MSSKQPLSSTVEASKLAQTSRELNDGISKIYNMIYHQIRVSINEEHRAKMVEALEEGTAIVTLDWAQKFLPLRSRETQQNYYGLRGISYHVTHVLTRLGSIDEAINQLVQRTLIHVFDSEYQVLIVKIRKK